MFSTMVGDDHMQIPHEKCMYNLSLTKSRIFASSYFRGEKKSDFLLQQKLLTEKNFNM